MSLIAPSAIGHLGQGWPIAVRRRIETVASQLVERYRIKQVQARDLWRLRSRFWRKVLSYTCCVLLCKQEGLSPLRLSQLVTH